MSKTAKIVLGVVIAVLILGFLAKSAMSFMSRKVAETMIENATNGQADVDMEGGKMTIQTSEGTFEMGQGLPKDWPSDAPVYAGATVQYSGTANPADGKNGMAIVMMTTDSPDNVKEFYEKELKENGWVSQGTMEGGGTMIMSATKDGSTLSVVIATADGQTNITMGIETK